MCAPEFVHFPNDPIIRVKVMTFIDCEHLASAKERSSIVVTQLYRDDPVVIPVLTRQTAGEYIIICKNQIFLYVISLNL